MAWTRTLASFAVAGGLVTAAYAWGDAPKVSSQSPSGIRRGEPAEVTLFGTGLEGHPRLLLPFEAEVTGVQVDGGSWKVRIQPRADTPVGAYLGRVRTDDGLSGPFLIAVGQLPQVVEVEDNGTFEAAQAIPTPVVVEGKAEANDVDFFRFAGKKGQRVVVDAQCARIGSGVDPSIRLSTSSRGFIASADDTPGLLTDARLTATLPADDDYVIELSDSRYQGGGRPVYRLLVGPVPVAGEVFPLGGRRGETVGLELRGGTLPAPSVAAATLAPAPGQAGFAPRITNQSLGIAGPGEAVLEVESLPPLVVGDAPEYREPVDPAAPPIRAFAPAVFNGRIEPKGDVDAFALGVTPGQVLRIAVGAADHGSALDGTLQVKGPDGAVLATADDTVLPALTPTRKAEVAAKKATPIHSPDPSLRFTVPAGMTEITLSLRDLRGEGGIGFPYRLSVEALAPSFGVSPAEAQVNIPRGGTAAVGVEVARSGYDGPITLTVADPPPGLVIRPGLVPPGQLAGALTITAPADSPFDLAVLKLVGEGSGGVRATASLPIFFAEQAGLPTNTATQDGLPASIALPLPMTLDAQAGPVEVVQGYRAAVTVRATRSKEAEDAALVIGSLPLPTGFTIDPTPLPAKAVEVGATVTTTPETPLGPATVAITAKGNVLGKERTLAAPLVRFEVVRPAAVELAAPTVEVKAGEAVEVKGKLVRRGPFNEPVTIKLDGLPAGLKADPVTLAPGQADFALKLAADPKAAAAQANARVALAFQVAKKDYATPPVAFALKVIAAP